VTCTAEIIARILRRRKERNLRIHVEKMSLVVEEEKDAESDITKNFGIDEEFCACFIDWQKTFDRLK
jgi:hypothetical protein